MVTESYNAFLMDFGIEAVIDDVSVRAIFDNGFTEVFGMDGAKPSLQCASSDAATVTRASTVVVDGVSYTIVSIQPDGTGMSMLILQSA